MPIDKIAAGHISNYIRETLRETRDMRARYIGDLLKNGWKIVFSVLRSAVQSPKRTVISIAQNADQVSRG